MPTFILQSFHELTTTALYAICQAREAVFVVEQACVYQDLDGLDEKCLHLQGFIDNTLIAYARIIPPDIHPMAKPAIGRVLTLSDYRGGGLARQLMQHAILACHTHYPRQPIYISAQSYLLTFYQSLGFVIQGDSYLEDGIPHIDMVLDNEGN